MHLHSQCINKSMYENFKVVVAVRHSLKGSCLVSYILQTNKQVAVVLADAIS